MDVMKGVFMFLLLSFDCLSRSEEVPVGKRNANGFRNILKTLHLNRTMGVQDLNTLLKSLGLHNCSDKAGRLHKCVTSRTLLKSYNISTTGPLSETDFANIASMIVYSFFLRLNKHSARSVSLKVEVYEELLEKYATTRLCEQTLDQILRDLKESIGKQLNNRQKCFSSRDILKDLNMTTEAEITKETLPEISTVIISKLLKKHCIEVRYKTPLPCPSFFGDKLFNKYARNDQVDQDSMKQLLDKLNIGKKISSDGKENENYKHHRRRRQVEPNHNNTIYDKCYSVDELFSIYHVDKTSGFKAKKFERLSVALLDQIESDACSWKIETETKHEKDKENKTTNGDNPVAEIPNISVWGFGLAAVSIVSLCSLIMIIPLMKTKFYEKFLVFLVSLAVGTLVGDAFFHLLPHATGFHTHPDAAHLYKDKSYLWKFLTGVAGVYGLVLFELTTHLILRQTRSVQMTTSRLKLSSLFSNTPQKPGNKRSSVKTLWMITCQKNKVEEDSSTKTEAKRHGTKAEKPPVVLMNRVRPDREFNRKLMGTFYGVFASYIFAASADTLLLAQVASKEEEASAEKTMKSSDFEMSDDIEDEKPIAPMAWTVIIGDTMHNIADGIAIGAAFTDSVFGGISTSIAVLCHEVPHELGDFVVLLSAGMSVRQALVANFVSALFCFIGLILGKLIGEILDVNLWILGITAGFFLYIALTNKLPELMHVSDHCELSKPVIMLLQNVGIILGISGMFFLAYYKKDINL